MTKQEYLAIEKSIYDKIASLYKEIHDVQEEYVKSNSIIKPGTSVKTSRGKEGVLVGYEFYNGDVKPIIVKIQGKKERRIYVYSGDTVEVIKETNQ